MSTVTCEHHVSAAFTVDKSARRRVGGLGKLLAVVARWFERSAQRRRLQQLDDHLLRDMGLSRADVEREVNKPFWAL